MIIFNDYGYSADKVIRYGLNKLSAAGIDAQWYVDNHRDDLINIRSELLKDNSTSLYVRPHIDEEDPLIPFAESFMQRQFIYPYPSILHGIKTHVDDDLIGYALSSFEFYKESEDYLLLVELAKKSEMAVFYSYIHGCSEIISKEKMINLSEQDIERLSIINAGSIINVSRNLLTKDHWNNALLSYNNLVRLAPSNKVDSAIFMNAVNNDENNLNSFLMIPGNSLTNIEGLCKEEMIEACIGQNFNLSQVVDYFSEEDLLRIIKSNPRAIGDCMFMGKSDRLDEQAIRSCFSDYRKSLSEAIKMSTIGALENILLDDSIKIIWSVKKEIQSRGIKIILSDNDENEESDSYSDFYNSSYDEIMVDSFCDSFNRKREYSIDSGVRETMENGFNEQWYIDNFSPQLKRIMIESDIGSNDVLLRDRVNGEHPLKPAAEYFIRAQFERNYSPDLFGIPVNLPESFVLRHAKFIDFDGYLGVDPYVDGAFSGTLFELIRDSQETLKKFYMSGFNKNIGKVDFASPEYVREIAIKNPLALNMIDPKNISSEDYGLALMSDSRILKFIPHEKVPKNIYKNVILSKRNSRLDIGYFKDALMSKDKDIDKSIIIEMMIKREGKIDSIFDAISTEDAVKIIKSSSGILLGTEHLGKVDDIDIAAIETSHQSEHSHNIAVKYSSNSAKIKADKLGIINYKLLSKSLAESAPKEISSKISRFGMGRCDDDFDMPF